MTHFHPLHDKLKNLPVATLVASVVRDVATSAVTVVAASTGSGKSMMLPTALADAYPHQIVVCVPRRFLALDAAYNVAELSETEIGGAVGYALGQMDGESSRRSPDTRVLYCTYGYAIRSGLIMRAETIVLDEVHEADEYISLTRALLHKRKQKNPELRILEMSATVDAQAQAGYWRDIAPTAIHTVEAPRPACDVLHESPMLANHKDRSAEDIIIELLSQNRKGIALFRPGVREVENSVTTLKKLLSDKNIRDVEVVAIHGGTPSDERRIARRAPRLGRKIIVGTNVIESGVNLRWLDAGVSDGYRKIPYHRDDTGADALVKEDQPQAGLLQQIGRINRDPAATGFERGLFILHAKKPFDMRVTQNTPAIQREGLNIIAFLAASLGADPTTLKWDIASKPGQAALPARLAQSKQELMRLQLIEGDWSLTKDGLFIKHLPVSPEMGALITAAKHQDDQRLRAKQPPRVMRDITLIAALLESHGLRHDTRKGHGADQHHTSDLLDGMNAFRALRATPIAETVLAVTEVMIEKATEEELATLQTQRKELEVLCWQKNVSLTGFIEMARLSDEIASRLIDTDKGVRVDTRTEQDDYDAERYGEVQSCILASHINQLFMWDTGARDLLRDVGKARNDYGQPFNGYIIGRGSIVPPPRNAALLTGNLREVQKDKPQGEPPLLVLTNVTLIPDAIFITYAAERKSAYQPILTSVELDGATLSASYFAQARFDMAIEPKTKNSAKSLALEEKEIP